MTNLFVYGTLLAGEKNHGLLNSVCDCWPCLEHDGPFGSTCNCGVCVALGAVCTETEAALVTKGCIEGSLINLGAFPMAVANPGHWIKGEVYEVDEVTLDRVDALESYFGPGNPRNLYERRTVPLSYYNRVISNAVQHMDVEAYYGAGVSLLQDWRDRLQVVR